MKILIPDRKKSGFTLTEIMMVVSLIALLSTVVMASLAKAKEKGRNAAVLSEVHQIRNQMALYANDHNGGYPNPAVPTAANYYCIGASSCIGLDGVTVISNQLAGIGSKNTIASENSFLNMLKPKTANATVYSDGFANFVSLPNYILYQCTYPANPCPIGYAWVWYNQKKGNTTDWHAVQINEVGAIGPTPTPT